MFGLRKRQFPDDSAAGSVNSRNAGTAVADGRSQSAVHRSEMQSAAGSDGAGGAAGLEATLAPVTAAVATAVMAGSDGAVPWSAIKDPAREREFQQRKMRLHEVLVEAINLKFASGADEAAARNMFRTAVNSLIGRTFPEESQEY
ncbi:MAG: hypothetical protein ACKO3T_07330, partial [Planctomycetaceae bacterium]